MLDVCSIVCAMNETHNFTYRMDRELRGRLQDHARRNHRNLTQTITALLTQALDADGRRRRGDPDG